MANYVLAYTGGSMGETEAEQQEVMTRWMEWFGALGDAIVDGGTPLAASATVGAGGTVSDGARGELTGYSIISAESLAEAAEKAKGCPVLAAGGTVEVYETVPIGYTRHPFDVAMADTDLWTVVHSERRSLAGDLAVLSEPQWSSPTPCADWTVRDVLAHMTATAKITPATFFPKLALSGLSLRRMQAKDIAAERGVSGADALERFEAVIASTKGPPGPKETIAGETIVHAQDIRGPLGIAHDYPVAVVVQVADSYKSSNLVLGVKRRIEGLSLRATDTTWSHGDGLAVAGPMMALLVAMTGRTSTLDQLEGPGTRVLRSRS